MKKLSIKKPTKKQLYLLIGVALLTAGLVYGCMEFRKVKKDINRLWIAVENVPNGAQALSGDFSQEYTEDNTGDVWGMSYRIANQYVETLDVQDTNYNYKMDEEPRYMKKAVRVVEVEVKNNDSFANSVYGNFGIVDDSGRIVRPYLSIKEDQDKNYAQNMGYGLELAPNGSGTLYLYFEDDGVEITKLYDVDNSIEVTQ